MGPGLRRDDGDRREGLSHAGDDDGAGIEFGDRRDAGARPRRRDLRRGCRLLRRRLPRHRGPAEKARRAARVRRADRRGRHAGGGGRDGRLRLAPDRRSAVRRLHLSRDRPAGLGGGAAALPLGRRVLGADHRAGALRRRHFRRPDAQPKRRGDLHPCLRPENRDPEQSLRRQGPLDQRDRGRRPGGVLRTEAALPRAVRRPSRPPGAAVDGAPDGRGAGGLLQRAARQGRGGARGPGGDDAGLRHDGACRAGGGRGSRDRRRDHRFANPAAARPRDDRRLGQKDRPRCHRARGDAHLRLWRRTGGAGAGALLFSPGSPDRARHRLGHALSARPRMGLFPGAGPRRRRPAPRTGGLGRSRMGRYVVKLPDIGEGMTEAEIVAWHVAPGQVIREEDPLVDIMTDKATVELPAPVAGTVVAINGAPGEKRAVGSELVVLEVAGEGNAADAARAHPPAAGAADPHPNPPPLAGEGAPRSVRAPLPSGPPPQAGEGGVGVDRRPKMPIPGSPAAKPLASPAVRRRAWDHGVALQFVPGSGPGGRITHQDLDAYIAAGAASATPPAFARRDGVEEVPVIGLRRAIAEHLQQSKRHIPHFSYVEEFDVTALEDLREQLNTNYAEREHLTLLPFLMRAIAAAAAVHPQVNAHYDDEAGVLHRHRAVNIGVATQTEGGLLVPVVHHAEALDLWQSAAELRRLAEAARSGKATRAELTGSTITITSLGALGGIAATPVINYPEVAIVGVNRIAERPVVRSGQITIRKMMNLSSSFDHRIVDGWEAASFVQRVKGLLEQPALLFIG